MAQRRIEQERRMKILADYTLEGSYRREDGKEARVFALRIQYE